MTQLKLCINRLLRWYERNGRRFIWRSSRDWYIVALAEFILVRTRASVAEKALMEILNAYPSSSALCADPSRAIRFLERVFRRIGLVKRARWVLDAVCAIHRGEVNLCDPRSLMSLRGIGNYIASALSSIVCGSNEPFVDTNVARVLSRCLGKRVSHDDARRIIRDLGANVAVVCFALIDLANALCKPRRPRCRDCPLASCCVTALSSDVG
ncbi:MAG: hypothetical protein GXO32_06255 [Crenarchaeota archaeon]|nr:hypothetical protein [Thermoproteota archaeon]